MAAGLSALFGLAPERAVRYLESKGYRLTWNWGEMQGEAHARAFTVAKLARLDILQDIRAAVETALKEGKTERWFQQQLEDTLKKKGWWGKQVDVDPVTGEAQLYQAGSRRRLQTIYRTNLQTAYMAGRQKQFDAEAARAPFVQYLAVLDKVTRPAHAALHGKVFQLDDPAWQIISPPNGFNSLLPGQRVTGHAYIGLQAWYSGPAVEVVGKSGARCSVTAQHPVLTSRGWVVAGNLKRGDQLVCYRADVGRGAMSADLNEYHAPPTIEEVFETLGLGGRCAVPRAAMNLYGDIVFCEGDVQVVASDRKLLLKFESAIAQFRAEFRLHDSDHESCALPADRASVMVDRGRGSSPCRLQRPSAPGVRPELARDDPLAIKRDPLSPELPGDAFAACAKMGGNILDARAIEVHVGGPAWQRLLQVAHVAPPKFDPSQCVGLRVGPLGNAALVDVFVGGVEANPSAHRDILEAQSGLVELDDVVDLRRFDYTGHVYDLETASGTIIAAGGDNTPHMILSNCRCRARNFSQRELDARGLKVQTDTQIHTREPKGKRPMDPRTGETPERWEQRGVSIPDPANPKERLYLWPDVGWDYNPGRASVANTASIVVRKLAEAPADLAKPVVQSLVLGALAQWLASPQGAFPLAIISEADAGLIGARARLALLSEETAAKQAARHPELTAAEYQHVQACVDRGERIQDGAHSLIYLLEVGGYVTVVKATKTGEGLFVTSFRRLSESQAKRDSEIRRLRGKGA